MRRICILIAFLLTVACACGVKGPPRPPDMAKKSPPADAGVGDGGE